MNEQEPVKMDGASDEAKKPIPTPVEQKAEVERRLIGVPYRVTKIGGNVKQPAVYLKREQEGLTGGILIEGTGALEMERGKLYTIVEWEVHDTDADGARIGELV